LPSTKSVTVANRLLASLPDKECQRLLAACESVELVFADILAEKGDAINHVYFPTGGFISLVEKIDGHASLEVGLVGNEGMVGTALVLGVGVSPLHARVQGPGPALRMEAAPFVHELEQSHELQRMLKRYIYIVMAQLAQTASCTHFHRVEARLARWLLMSQDRAHSNKFHVTHECLAYMLGVRRVGVTRAATSLHNLKLIDYSRGDITILDRAGLKAAACGCYEVDNATYQRMMG
jgi:CRP-like cAMP-binding protein